MIISRFRVIIFENGGINLKILFATHNRAKLKLYKEGLEKYNMEVLSLDDINIDKEVNETGNTPAENAYIKAKEYSEASNMITVSVDDGLQFYDIPDESQPGVNVRRVNGEVKNDEELINHYINEVNKYGINGELKGKWIKSIAIAFDKNNVITHDFNVEKIFINKASEKRNPGYPLDSITLDPIFLKYTIDLTKEERNIIQEKTYNEVFEFVLNNIKSNSIN